MADKTIPALKILRGNVGISTASPAVKLHVEGNDIRVNTEGSYQAKTLYFRYSSGAAINSDSYLTLGTGGSPAERMRVISNGNIGIATTTPGAKLDVNGSVIFRGANSWAGNDSQGCSIYLSSVGYGVYGNFSNYARNLVKANSNYVEVGQNSTLVYGVKFIVGSNAANGFMFQSNISGSMTTLMNIRGNTGNVGIGTNSPATKLDVYSSSAALRISASGGTSPQLELSSVGAVNWKLRANISSSDFRITKDSTDYLTILSGGSVGVGTASPGSLFTISGNSDDGDNACALRIIDEDTTGGSKLPAIMFYGGSTIQGRIRGGDGTFAIAVGSTPTTAFSINTTSRKIAFGSYGSGTHTGTAAYKLAVDSSGNIIETAVGAGQVDGSGTANKVAKWTDGDTIGNSQITDNGTSVGINQGSPNAANRLEVHNGNITITSGKQLISTNTYSQAPIGMLTIQGPTNGGTTLNSDTWGLVIGPQHTRSATANTYYPGIAFNHLLNHTGQSTYNSAPQAWIGTRLHDTPGSERDFLVFATKSGTGTSSSDVPLERMCIDPVYGSIGIGTTDPDSQMQIGRSQTTDAFNGAFIKLRPSNTTNSTGLTSITLGTSTVDNYGYSISGWRAGTDGSPYLRIQRHSNSATGTDVMVMNNLGNIGIGTTDPSKKLHVIGAAFIDNTGASGGLTVEASSDAKVTLQVAQNTAYYAQLAAHYNYTTPMTLRGYGGIVLAQNTGYHKTLLYAANAEQIRITTTGVGIGLGGSDPTNKLHVGGSTKIEGPLVGVLNNSFTRIENFILDTKGEDAPVINHQLNNDLALLRVKGNTVTYSGLSSNPGDTETDRFFEANSYFGDIAASEISNASTGFTITLNSLPRNLTYTTRVGISFATPSWRCSYVKIEVYRAGSWNTIREETSNPSATVYQYYNTGSSGITKIRYTLKTPVTTSTRIVSLFAFNYNSTGATGYYLSQAGGSVYGNVGIGTNNPSCLLQVGTDGVQGGASLAIRRNGDAINFGHVNGAGYGSVIGCSSNNGYPHIGFMCEAGTNINTFRTRGLKGNVIFTNTSGTLNFGQVTNANADNQSVTTRVAIESDGDAYFYGGNWFCNTNNSTNVTNGGLYINRGGGLYAYALATARSGTALNGVDFWDYHGVGLVFGPDSSTKVLTVKSNIGIGTTDPGYKLEVKASVTGNWLSRIYNTATSGNSGGLLVRMDEPGSTGRALGVYANGGYKFTVEPDGEVQILSGSAYTTHLNYQNSGNHYISMGNSGFTNFRGGSNGITTMTVKGDGKVGIKDTSPQTALAVNGEASFGDGSRLSLIGLSIASSASSPNIKIRTKIPFALSGADFTVNIKGFIYGLTETANLMVCWHYYNSTFYSANCSSSGSWAPTIQLSAEDWDSSGTKKVCICLSTPGYWVKAYVESMFSHSYNDQYTDGWTWVDETASGTGNDLASLSYRSDFGNNFKMLSNGCVGIGGGILTNAQLTVNGGLAVGDATYQSNMNNGAADFSVDCNGTPMISWVSNYLQVGGTGQNWSMKMYNGLLQTYSNNLTITAGGTGTSYKLYLGTNGQTQTITCNNGSVGINTNSPAYKLDVYGGDARIGTNLRLGNGSAAGNSTNPAITVSGVTTAGVYFENSGVGFGAGSGSKYLFLSSAGNASLGGNGFFKQLGDRPYGTDNLNDYYRSNDEASFCQFYRYDATHGHWANSSGTLTTNAPSTLTQTTSQIYSYGSLLTLRSINSFRGQFYFAHSASEFYWRSGWGTSSDQNWTRIVGDRNIQTVIHNVGHISTKAGNNLSVGGSITVQPGSGDGILFLKNSAASQILRLDQNSIRTTTTHNINIFTNGNTNQLCVASNGNVGISDGTPENKLTVNGSSRFKDTMFFADSNRGIISWGTMGGGTGFGMQAASGNALSLGANAAWDHIVINTSGSVGIGTNTPAATLDVKQGSSNTNNKLMKVAEDVLSVYKVTGLSNHTVTLTCGSYFQAEVVITANQTNGGTYNNLYIRGIWSNNHHSHHWDEIENIGSLSGSSFSIAVSANDVSNSGKLTITHTYSSGSFSQMVVRVTDLYGSAHSYSIT